MKIDKNKSSKNCKKKMVKKNQKSPKIWTLKKNAKKNVFSLFCQLRLLVFDQSSPVQPILESRGGSLSVTE